MRNNLALMNQGRDRNPFSVDCAIRRANLGHPFELHLDPDYQCPRNERYEASFKSDHGSIELHPGCRLVGYSPLFPNPHPNLT